MNEYQQKANDAGKEAGDILIKALNSMTYDDEAIKGFVDSLTHTHRTLQQASMRAIMALIMAWAEMDEKGCCDLRNEATVKFCSKIKALALEDNTYLPFI